MSSIIPPGGTIGAIVSAANVGGGAGVYRNQAPAGNLNLRSLVGLGAITVTQLADTITIAGGGGPGAGGCASAASAGFAEMADFLSALQPVTDTGTSGCPNFIPPSLQWCGRVKVSDALAFQAGPGLAPTNWNTIGYRAIDLNTSRTNPNCTAQGDSSISIGQNGYTSPASVNAILIGKNNVMGVYSACPDLAVVGNFNALGGVSQHGSVMGTYNSLNGAGVGVGAFNFWIVGSRNSLRGFTNINSLVGHYNTVRDATNCFLFGDHNGAGIPLGRQITKINLVGTGNTSEHDYANCFGFQNSVLSVIAPLGMVPHATLLGRQNTAQPGYQISVLGSRNSVGLAGVTAGVRVNVMGASNRVGSALLETLDTYRVTCLGNLNYLSNSSNLAVLGDSNTVPLNNPKRAVEGVMVGHYNTLGSPSLRTSIVGSRSSATGNSSFVGGAYVVSGGNESVAIGSAIALGAASHFGVVLGSHLTVPGGVINAVCVGNWSGVYANFGISVGTLVTNSAIKGIAVGHTVNVYGGADVAAVGNRSSVIGASVKCSVFGFYNQISASDRAAAIGNLNRANGIYGQAFGLYNFANAHTSVALGIVNNRNVPVLNVTTGALTGVPAPSASIGINSVAVGIDNRAESLRGVALGFSNRVNGIDGLAVGNGSIASGVGSLAAGWNAVVTGNSAIAIGPYAHAYSLHGIAVGLATLASGQGSVAVGYNAVASGAFAFAAAAGAIVTAAYGLALGLSAHAYGISCVAIGRLSGATGAKGVALGANAVASGSASTALGAYAVASGSASAALGAYAVSRIAYSVNLGGPIIVRKDNGEIAGIAFQTFNGACDFLFTKEVDLKALAAQTISLPAGCHFWVEEVGLILTTLTGTVVTQPTVQFGISGTPAKFLGPTLCTLLTATFKRERFSTLLADDGEIALRAEVTVIAAGSADIKGRFYFKGVLVEDE